MTVAKRAADRARPSRRTARRSAVADRVPAIDLQRFLDGFKLPGVDVKSIADGKRAEIRAVALANRRAYDGMKVLTRREAELLRDATAQWRAAIKQLGVMDGGDFAARRTELARRVVAQALDDVRRLAEAVARSQAAACGVVRERQDSESSNETRPATAD